MAGIKPVSANDFHGTSFCDGEAGNAVEKETRKFPALCGRNQGADGDRPKTCAGGKSPRVRGVRPLRVDGRPYLSDLVGGYDTAGAIAAKNVAEMQRKPFWM